MGFTAALKARPVNPVYLTDRWFIMLGKSHIVFGTAAAASLAVYECVAHNNLIIGTECGYLIPMLWIPLAPVGSLLPDIDKEGSRIRRAYDKSSLFLFTASLLLLLVTRRASVLIVVFTVGISVILTRRVEHRRETHSLLFILLLTLAMFALRNSLSAMFWISTAVFNLMMGLVLGAISHIILDNFNYKRMHIFFPLEIVLQRMMKRRKPVYIIPTIIHVTTGTPGEKIIVGILTALISLLWLSMTIAEVMLR
jgi:membrane-bound metal-dependent hydrolase YbcI (DUF457 family)